jgi:uncharacterized peroxidase-related enzyme
MSRVELVEPETVDDDELAGLFERIERLEGHLPDHYRAELNFPEHLTARLRSTVVLWEEGDLSMPEVQYVGVAVSQANGCANCVGAFCTALSHGLGVDDDRIRAFLAGGTDAVDDDRLAAILDYALATAAAPDAVTDAHVEALRDAGLDDRGIVQLTHLVGDFAAWNLANDALDTPYDYREVWREAASL